MRINKFDNLSYSIWIDNKYVGYSITSDELFIYWLDGDIVHCLGANGLYQVCFIDESSPGAFMDLGEL